MPSDPGGYWALEKSANPGNVLNFVRNDGSGDTIPYTLNPTGTPANATDLATKAYVDSNSGAITGPPKQVLFFDDPSGAVTSDPGLAWEPRKLDLDGRLNIFNVTTESQAMGAGCLENEDQGIGKTENTGAGWAALNFLTTGIRNTAFGHGAGLALTEGEGKHLNWQTGRFSDYNCRGKYNCRKYGRSLNKYGYRKYGCGYYRFNWW